MNRIGPLLIVFAFFAVLFVVGKFLQRSEKKKRLAEKVAAQKRVKVRFFHTEVPQTPDVALKGEARQEPQRRGQGRGLGYDA
ncbi:MAG TPA: hypothetical protein VFE08_15845 [Candidatus Sulfotelmatobacter sp.]|jgi:hypothetical protein|nr:hypothetical protein [Candidatus Sulfotelmatobacter sp.]